MKSEHCHSVDAVIIATNSTTMMFYYVDVLNQRYVDIGYLVIVFRMECLRIINLNNNVLLLRQKKIPHCNVVK